MDGRPKWKKKTLTCVFKEKRVYVWTGKTDSKTIRVDGEIFKTGFFFWRF